MFEIKNKGIERRKINGKVRRKRKKKGLPQKFYLKLP